MNPDEVTRQERDKKLVLLALEGDVFALEEIVTNYHENLYRFGLKLLRHPSDAEDVVQETYLRLAQHLKTIKNPEKIRSWLYTVTLNLCRKKMRFDRIRRWISLSYDPELNEEQYQAIDLAPNPEQVAGELIQAELLEKLASRLPPALRETALLSFFHGLSNTEVSDILKISPENVRIRIHRARERLWEESKKLEN